ncbi:MAG: hypothetical protein NXH78_15940 [Hyphomonadaceae bacterium]|nr:hypothetical protein [Hyphomonadaceae bacterium]
MIRRLTYASLGLVLTAAAYADPEPGTDQPSDEPVRENSAAGLDAFVETAIRGGLLVRNGEAEPGDAPAMTLAQAMVCSSDYPLDFSVEKSLRRFTELPAAGADDAGDANAAFLKNLKSKLALGLYSEAGAMLAFAPDEEWQVYRKFIELMSARSEPDIAYFRDLTACHGEADFWLAVAELRGFEPDGVERIQPHVPNIRGLPHNLRQDVATLTIPTLILQRRADLAQQVLSTFSVEEIENSTQLMALKTAIADMPNGSESDDRLVMLMSRPTLKLPALLILIERNDTLRPTIKEFALEEAWNILEQNDTKHGFEQVLAFVMQNLESDNLYAGLQRVQTLPIAEAEEIRAAVDRNIIESLDAYLVSAEPAASLKGLKTLTQFHTSLPYDAQGNALRRRGAEIALELGLISLVEALLEQVERDEDVAQLLAQAAFWSGADDKLFDLRAAYPSLIDVNRLAGIRAVQAGAAEVAARSYDNLDGAPATQLELIEHAALADDWALYAANVETLAPELSLDDGLRLERVKRIHRGKQAEGPARPERLRPYQIAPLLEASKLALSSSQAGASHE